ncbi:MAG: type II toxin-antitoxin system VapC family toxin [Bryobacteraceae bacterium]
MAFDRIFVDTWAWIVLASARDPAFGVVSRMRTAAANHEGAWVTTDYVLAETITRLFPALPFAVARRFVEGIFEASRQGRVDIEQVTPERFTRAFQLRLRYHDKPRISFTDLTSFVVMRELGIQHSLTADRHFEQVGMAFVRLPRPVQ